jgi:hypothetical protein
MTRPWQWSRAALVVVAAAFLVIGVPSFLFPAWAAGEFPWAVGPFLAQTIGGWSIGTALIALHAVWKRDPVVIYPLLVYLWLFGIGQALVVVLFLDRLQTGHLLTWPYVAGLGALIVAWVAGAGSSIFDRVDLRPVGQWIPTYAKAFGALVGLFVLFLAIGTLVAGPSGLTASGGIFPEPMGLFSIRAFSALLFAIAASIGSVLLARSVEPYLALGWAGLYLVVPITLAALLNLSLFSFSFSRPGHALYLLAYVVVGIVIAATIMVVRRRPAA